LRQKEIFLKGALGKREKTLEYDASSLGV